MGKPGGGGGGGHPGLGGTQACALQPWVSWVVPKIIPPGASTPLWATGTHGHPGTKLRHCIIYFIYDCIIHDY